MSKPTIDEQIARKELEYFKHRYNLTDRQCKELDDTIEILIKALLTEAENNTWVEAYDQGYRDAKNGN